MQAAPDTFNLDRLMTALVAGDLSSAEFEAGTRYYWESGRFIQSCAGNVAAGLRERAEHARMEAYRARMDAVKFNYVQLFGAPGRSGGIYTTAPGEVHASPLIRDRNRPPHVHDTARISVITRGRAILFIHRVLDGADCVVEAPVEPNDVLFWPGGVAHTFDAGREGFCLLSAMSRWLSPNEEDFAVAATELGLDFDSMPRVHYADYLHGLDG